MDLNWIKRSDSYYFTYFFFSNLIIFSNENYYYLSLLEMTELGIK